MDLQDNPLIVVSAGIAIVALIFWYVATEIDRRKRNVGTIAIGIVVALCLVAVLPVKEKTQRRNRSCWRIFLHRRNPARKR